MQNIGEVSVGRRGWKIPTVEVTESGLLSLLLIVDVIGEVTCRAGEVKETGKRCKIYPCVEMGITILMKYLIFLANGIFMLVQI